MRPKIQLQTERLTLRRWFQGDLLPFSRMNEDPRVMRYFPNRLTSKQTEAFVWSIEEHFDRYGYGLYAVDLIGPNTFIGFVGLYTASFEADFTPCPEIGWRLDSCYWGNGYAAEAATACLREGFIEYNMEEIFSFTSVINKPSIAVMKRIGLHWRQEFIHPNIKAGHELSKHVLYSLSRDEYSRPRTNDL